MRKSQPLTGHQVSNASGLSRLIGEPCRLEILLVLDDAGKLNVSEIGEILGSGPALASQRIRALRISGALVHRKDGLTNRYTLSEKGRVLVTTARSLLLLD